MSSVRDAYWPVGLVLVGLNAIAVGLRVYVRVTKKAVGYDDGALVVSFAGFVLFVAFELVAISNGIGATKMEPSFNPLKAAKYFTISQVVYILTMGISKVGVALVLLRLADGADMQSVRIVVIVSLVIASIISLVVALIYSVQCMPLSVAWGVGKGTCLSTKVLGNAGLALSATDVGVNWFYSLLPIYMLRKAQLPLRMKITVLILLGMGAVSSVATIIRLKYLVDVTRLNGKAGLASAEIIDKTLIATVYSIVEIGLGILAAALTALRPLLRKLPCFSSWSTGGGPSNTTPGSKMHRSTDRIKGPSIRLRDMSDAGVEDADSQENIVTPQSMDITKNSSYEVSYEDGSRYDRKTTAQTHRPEWQK